MKTNTLQTFCTDRLVAARLQPEHFDDLYRMHQDTHVMATLGGLRSYDTTQQLFHKLLDHWDCFGYGVWILRDKLTQQFVGRAGLRHNYVGGQNEIELLYALMSEFWAHGLTTEISAAIVQLGFEQIGLQSIVCFTLPTNRASQRVMEKVGFVYERDIVHANLPHVFYRLTADAWQQRNT